MSFPNRQQAMNEFERLYQHHVTARRQFDSFSTYREILNQYSSLISAVLLAIIIAYQFLGDSFTLAPICNLIWDIIVYISPGPLIFAIDGWKNSDKSKQMNSTSSHAAKSEALRRIMGLDRAGGLMATVFRSRSLSSAGSNMGMKHEVYRPPGLGNYDNSCYQNSVLQGLSSLSSFPEYLSKCMQTINAQGDGRSVAQTLRTLIYDLNDVSNHDTTLWTPRLLKSMSTWTQQDAQEYYSKILDDIDRGVSRAIQELKPKRGFENEEDTEESASSQHSDDSGYQSEASRGQLSDMKRLRNPLEGLLAQRVACVECGYSEGLSLIPFNCLTLSLGLDKNEHDIYDRLDAYTKVEEIDGVECPKCTLLKARRLLRGLVDTMREKGTPEEQLEGPLRRLEAVDLALEEDDFEEKTIRDDCKISPQSKVTSTKTKQIVVARPPQSLVLHVNRSVFDPSTFDMIKNSAPVRFPGTLDLGPWCLGSSSAFGPKNKLSGGSEELWHTGPRSSMIAGDSGPSRLTGPIYELRAAVTHYGRHENGHYICYKKYPKAPSAPQEKEKSETAGGETSEKEEGEAPAEEDSNTPKLDEDITEEETVPAEPEDTWWRLSDHNVSPVSDDVIMSLAPGVFMLFYECVDPEVILDAEEGEGTSVPAEATLTEDVLSVASTDDAATIHTVDTNTDAQSEATITSVEDNETVVQEDSSVNGKGV
mgnify:CR=1 FL=1